MKYFYCLWVVFFSIQLTAQNKKTTDGLNEFEASYFYGTILEHNPDIGHLITQHPHGFVLSYNRKTYGFKEWSRRYNYPDHGFSFIYQNLENYYLGESYSLYAHLSFYFLNRHLMARIGQGLAYNTKPYNPETNYINNAYGTSILSSTMLMANYKQQNIFHGLGIQAGITLVHYSNANVKAPNNSTNSFTFNIGMNYLLDNERQPRYIPQGPKEKFSEPIHYNFVLRSGVNASDVIGMGQYPFLTVAGYADKRINKKSTLQVGAEVFFSPMLKELIHYRSIAYPSDGLSGHESSTRVGLFVGHLLTFNKISFVANLGYYVYYPYDFEGRIYNRLGIQRDFGEHFFGVVSVHSHGAKAEAASLSIGYRL